MYYSMILFQSKPVQKHLIYDRIGGKKENVLLRFLVGRGKYYGDYSMVSGPHV